MNTTPKTPLVLLADAADELHALADRLTDAAEELLPKPQPPAVALPTVDEVAAIIRDGGFSADTARAVLDLIAARVPVWVPVNVDDIRPGMRVRWVRGNSDTEGSFTVRDIADDRLYFENGHVRLYFENGHVSRQMTYAWFIDPRTVPAEPEDPRVAVVAQALSDALDDNGVTTCDWTAEARYILALLDDAVRADA